MFWGCGDFNTGRGKGEEWREIFASLLGTIILLLIKGQKRKKMFLQTAGAQNNQTGEGIVFAGIYHFNQCFTSQNPQA